MKFTTGTGMISELVVYETGGIKQTSVQTPTQLVGKHVSICDSHRKKIPVKGKRYSINSKERRGSIRSAFCSLLRPETEGGH
jgi:hypothetical protein